MNLVYGKAYMTNQEKQIHTFLDPRLLTSKSGRTDAHPHILYKYQNAMTGRMDVTTIIKHGTGNGIDFRG